MKTGAFLEASEAASGTTAFCFDGFICLGSGVVRVASVGEVYENNRIMASPNASYSANAGRTWISNVIEALSKCRRYSVLSSNVGSSMAAGLGDVAKVFE